MFKHLTQPLCLLLTTCTIIAMGELRFKPGVVKDIYPDNFVNDPAKRTGSLRPVRPSASGSSVRPIPPSAINPANPSNDHHIATAKVNLSGKYYIKECFDGKKVVSTPRWYKFTLEISAHAAGPHHTYVGYRLTYTVGNKLWAHMTQVRNGHWIIHNDGQTQEPRFQSPNTDEAKAERFVLNFEKWFSHFKVHADVVTLYGKNGSRMVLARARAQTRI